MHIETLTHSGVCISKDHKDITKIKKELKAIKESSFGNFPEEVFNVFKIDKEFLYVPLYYYIEKYGDKLKIDFPESTYCKNLEKHTIEPRPNQLECISICKNELDKNFGGGIINLTTGSGKTIVSLYLIAFKKIKTLIIVNKRELIEQWKTQIKKFIPNARIGLIQGATFDIENKDIVLGMLHTITLKNNLTSEHFKWVDFCIIDEVHNLGSSQFSKCLFKLRSRYIIGLTATIERKDKLEKVFIWHIGKVLYSNTGISKKQKTDIHTYVYSGKSSKCVLLRDGITPNVSTMITNISEDKERNNMILLLLKKYILEPKRNILFISDRIAQLKWFYSKLGDDISGLYIGSKKPEELQKVKDEKQVILATYKIASEGFDCPRLNTLFLGTPRRTITQTIGRIYRKIHSLTPCIIDIVDQFSLFKNQFYGRKRIYIDQIEKCNFYKEEEEQEEQKEKENTKECLFDSD